MSDRPYTILSSAVSVDGYLDDMSSGRLLLSNTDDFDRVDALRSTCDAILVGANTIRKDDPRLTIRSKIRRADRMRNGLPANPMRITLTSSADLPATSKIFQHTDKMTYIYCSQKVYASLSGKLGETANVIPTGEEAVDLGHLLSDLKMRRVHRLLIEGGQRIATDFLSSDLIDEIQLAIAPFFVGEHLAPRFVEPTSFPFNKHQRMQVASSEIVGDMVVITYKLTD